MPEKPVLLLALFSLMMGCAHKGQLIRDDIIADPTERAFSVCYRNSCESLAQLRLKPAQWQQILALYETDPTSAAHERKLIATAIALFETQVGQSIGTHHDKGGNWEGLGSPGQMDCIDEAINSSSYLRILQQADLLQFHRVEDPVTRWRLFGWPHSTAVISEMTTGNRFAVDSWFHDNGVEPEIIPLDIWRAGWQPDTALPAQVQ